MLTIPVIRPEQDLAILQTFVVATIGDHRQRDICGIDNFLIHVMIQVEVIPAPIQPLKLFDH